MSELNKLRWRCRRGTLELDLLLLRYLENAFLSAEPGEQQAFLQLLDCEDTELMRYLMGESIPARSALVPLVSKIRALPVRQ
ncbi:MAG: succinate dehydrogenase assembly factor 2 [Methylomonas sp.]|jgi:antitoxin CptB|uniref:FAD assembly factor SdhE n=1 Tax=Methylomonas sp. TaxID=418 RepID=UPI0025F32F10|nr:succinate dehydrogenase assembly factor 2 [Methylomonas sp.]MCK9609461.1 succinate dehydrogenase assembly factor 2 [Methylomonas sp.]